MSDRLRQLPALTVATARRLGWPGIAGCIAAAVAITWLVTQREAATQHHAMTVLRWSAALLAGGLASVLDDPTEDDLAGAVTPVSWRRLHALTLAAIPTALGWVAAVTVTDQGVPWAALSIEAAALVLLGCAVSSTRVLRRSNLPAGLTGTLLPAFLLVVAMFLPPQVALLVDPGDPAWGPAHRRWAVLAAVAVVVLATAARDPARRTPWRTLRPAAPPSTTATLTESP